MRHGATYVPNNFMGRHRNFKTCLQQNQPKGATQNFLSYAYLFELSYIIDQNRERERRSRTRHHYEEKEIQNMSAEARLGC